MSRRSIEQADRIVLNKIDLADDEPHQMLKMHYHQDSTESEPDAIG